MIQSIYRTSVLALAGLILTVSSVVPAQAGDDHHKHYAFALWGDLPYSDAQALTGLPNLIADMNSQDLAFSVHDGDLKGGGGSATSVTPTTCSDAFYDFTFKYFMTLKAPAMFTPGDNDWTDCDRPANGAYNSLERLEREREVFFSKPFSLGKHRLKQEVQAKPYVENRRWTIGKVTYATVNVPGSCNNLCDTAPDAAEFAARNEANIYWVKDTFKKAKKKKSVAVMFITQANPGWDRTDPTRAPLRDPKTLVEKFIDPVDGQEKDSTTDGYKDFLSVLRDEVIAFAKPVAYVHGDSHYYRVDKPLLDSKGLRLENFTRIETFGNNAANGVNDVHWLKVLVNPESREVFSYQAQLVPGNRVAVPAPTK